MSADETVRGGGDPETSGLGEILVVEDDPVAATLIRHHLHALGLANPVQVAGDGDEAVAWLRQRIAEDDRQVPPLILLDHHVPGRSGLEVLRWISDQPALRAVPVLVLTSESDVADISEAHALGARSYLIKPVGFDALEDVVRSLELRWAILSPGTERP